MTSLQQQISKLSRWPSPGQDSSARLALELAMRIKPAQQICDEYDLTVAELKHRLANDRQFRLQVSEYKTIWNNPLNAAERVRVKTGVMAEDGLVDVWKIMTNPELNPQVRLDAHKHISRLADVEPKREQDSGGSRFAVTIVLPGSEPVEVVANQAPEAIEDAA